MSRVLPLPVTPKTAIIRDRAYLDYLRTQPCVITGHRGTENLAVEACHIGTLGKGIKSSDDETLPMNHDSHMLAHRMGEVSFFRKYAPDWLLRAALRAYARELYREWRG